ncbi:hypothetical protein NUSPORA_00653 [Nucleospora cyclopteri]
MKSQRKVGISLIVAVLTLTMLLVDLRVYQKTGHSTLLSIKEGFQARIFVKNTVKSILRDIETDITYLANEVHTLNNKFDEHEQKYHNKIKKVRFDNVLPDRKDRDLSISKLPTKNGIVPNLQQNIEKNIKEVQNIKKSMEDSNIRNAPIKQLDSKANLPIIELKRFATDESFRKANENMRKYGNPGIDDENVKTSYLTKDQISKILSNVGSNSQKGTMTYLSSSMPTQLMNPLFTFNKASAKPETIQTKNEMIKKENEEQLKAIRILKDENEKIIKMNKDLIEKSENLIGEIESASKKLETVTNKKKYKKTGKRSKQLKKVKSFIKDDKIFSTNDDIFDKQILSTPKENKMIADIGSTLAEHLVKSPATIKEIVTPIKEIVTPIKEIVTPIKEIVTPIKENTPAVTEIKEEQISSSIVTSSQVAKQNENKMKQNEDRKSDKSKDIKKFDIFDELKRENRLEENTQKMFNQIENARKEMNNERKIES